MKFWIVHFLFIGRFEFARRSILKETNNKNSPWLGTQSI